MNFDEYIVNQIDKKYKGMLLGSNEKTNFPTIKSVDTYEKKKTEFFKRLNQEKNAFNKAIDTVSKTRQDNLAEKDRIKQARIKAREEAERKRRQEEEEYNEKLKHDKKKIIKLAIVMPIILVLFALVMIFTISNNLNVWYKEIVVSEFGFQNCIVFFNTFSRQWGIGYYAFITSLVITIIGWIVVAIIVYSVDGGGGLGIVGAVFGIGLVVSGLSIIIPLVIIRAAIGIIVHLIQYLFYPWVVLIVVLSMIIPLIVIVLKMQLKKSKTKSGIIFLPLITIGTVLLCVYSSFATSNNKKYYSQNGSNFESALVLSGEGTYNIRNNDNLYMIYKDTYLKFITEEAGNYNIKLKGEELRKVYLYDQQKNILSSYEFEENTPFCLSFEANKTYYFKVAQYEINYSYTIEIEKTPVCQEVTPA